MSIYDDINKSLSIHLQKGYFTFLLFNSSYIYTLEVKNLCDRENFKIIECGGVKKKPE